MSLKRKASFSTITSPNSYSTYNNPTAPIPFLAGATITIDEPPRHLHSRTRKRFRNDRPDDQTIFNKTLHWLFSAQKKHQHNTLPTSPDDSAASEEPSPFQSSTPDPNQQTLRKFFQPVQPSPKQQFANQSTTQLASNMSIAQPQSGWAGSNAHSQSGSSSLVSGGMDVDMDMDMGCAGDSSMQVMYEKRWVGGIGWI
ncbi:hypothetical protein FQN55_007800 [Onygenales sp. PD_40]|nr:hypothetical protein FQN55_007800 [Onygenales sp. PD_40]KAK2787293.1 hypothetical protein FQN53_005452 [Emmonsiellopsis sp. PD_33]KAK2792480.1 hypothetical protein FQN52_003415 [Onygenales sp. PD_12]